MPLITLFTVFIAKYYIGFSLNIDPQLFLNPDHAVFIALLYGLLTGFVLGRLGYGLRCMKSGPYLTLSPASNA